MVAYFAAVVGWCNIDPSGCGFLGCGRVMWVSVGVVFARGVGVCGFRFWVNTVG